MSLQSGNPQMERPTPELERLASCFYEQLGRLDANISSLRSGLDRIKCHEELKTSSAKENIPPQLLNSVTDKFNDLQNTLFQLNSRLESELSHLSYII
jgi:hypothetical protein